MTLFIPKDYDPKLNVRDTQYAIKFIRDTFQREFGKALKLERISAPLFVTEESGLNDNLNGVERIVEFNLKDLPNCKTQVVQSLAKWKRYALKKYDFKLHEGLYTNMNAIRIDEDLDNLHSSYVDQWDWEMVIDEQERNLNTLYTIADKIFTVIKFMEHHVWYKFPNAVYRLPEKMHHITSQELLDMYPNMASKERENAICKEYGCVFISKIGGVLSNNTIHDGRAPDYDDWELNGDILFWFEPLQCSLEISSMGIRVSEKSIYSQCKQRNVLDRLKLPYHEMVMNKKLPYTIGGGIGQSRLCMLLLGRVHIGEVQASLWPEEMIKLCKENNITLL